MTPRINSFFFDRQESLDSLQRKFHNLSFVWLRQIHSAKVLEVTDPETFGRPEGDALVTRLENVALAVHTADCVPLLASAGEVIGACHGGWRGISLGIIGVWVKKMCALGAENNKIKVSMGPSIGPCHFEVGNDVAESLCAIDDKKIQGKILGEICRPHADKEKKYIDLPKLAKLHLTGAGVPAQNILMTGDCTFCDAEKYFSYRRNKGEKGRLEAVIFRSR